jgi:heme-degrading monooxygenase HmoA
MNQNEIATEIVNFKTINRISENELIKIINNLDTNFLSKTKGYIDTELIKGKEEQAWTIIIHWRTTEEGNKAIKEFANSPLTEEYRNVVDQKSVGFHFNEQIQTWKAAQ